MLKNIIFDLDGTLLPQDQNEFIQNYFYALTKKIVREGFDAKTFIKGIHLGTEAMLKNTGKKTNERVFWEAFEKATGHKEEEVSDTFLDYYTHEFNQLGKQVKPYKGINELLILLKEKGYNLILATNPLFPPIATQNRIKWAGVDASVFTHITTYDNSRFSKPNILYYKEIFENFNILPNESLMIGNDMIEDMVVTELGCDIYIVTNHLINKTNLELPEKASDMKNLIKYLKMLL